MIFFSTFEIFSTKVFETFQKTVQLWLKFRRRMTRVVQGPQVEIKSFDAKPFKTQQILSLRSKKVDVLQEYKYVKTVQNFAKSVSWKKVNRNLGRKVLVLSKILANPCHGKK